MELRPTVKRDLSLFSVQSWQKGYLQYFKQKLGWSYPILFYYDGTKVNFFHTIADFSHFKEIITQKIIEDKILFDGLNTEFLADVTLLKSITKNIDLSDISTIFNLGGKIMSFYIFVVSDAFVVAVPDAWRSRIKSEGILYEVDEKIEKMLKKLLKEKKYPPSLSHFLTYQEIQKLQKNISISPEEIKRRKKKYIVYKNAVLTDTNFQDFCLQYGFVNPEDKERIVHRRQLSGMVASRGYAKGKVVILDSKKKINQIRKGSILVTVMTNVTHTLAMKKAEAIVTDEGGVTCHAAILSRELKKPCIVGTKYATKILKDNDMVEVDAIQGVVRKI